MSHSLIISVSGLRGVVGESLTAAVAHRYALAYGSTRHGQPIVVGRDSRSHGEMLYHAAISGLLEAGCKPLLAGCIPTPTCGVLIQAQGAAGGLLVTASHNPPAWNGIKLFHPSGRALPAIEGEKIASLFRDGRLTPVSWQHVHRATTIDDPYQQHLDRVLRLVDIDAIRRRRFRVLLDANHGAGGPLGQRLLEALGCDVVPVGVEPTGAFRHPPEPLPEHLTETAALAREANIDVGFAQDPDADRLVLIDERGSVLREEYTLAIVAEHVFSRSPGPFVINLSTSRVVEEAARRHGATVYRSPVGEANVVEMALQVGARLAGEGNGGVIHGDVVWIRDSFTGMALVLDALAASGKKLSELAGALPQWSMVKSAFPLERGALDRVLNELPDRFPDAAVNRSDGLRLETADWWLHVRGSNTEPIVRVIAESRNEQQAHALIEQVREYFGA